VPVFVGGGEQATNSASRKMEGWKASGFARDCVEASSLALLYRTLVLSNCGDCLIRDAKSATMSVRWRRIEPNYSLGLGLVCANGL
jgi:hypothetical protein